MDPDSKGRAKCPEEREEFSEVLFVYFILLDDEMNL